MDVSGSRLPDELKSGDLPLSSSKSRSRRDLSGGLNEAKGVDLRASRSAQNALKSQGEPLSSSMRQEKAAKTSPEEKVPSLVREHPAYLEKVPIRADTLLLCAHTIEPGKNQYILCPSRNNTGSRWSQPFCLNFIDSSGKVQVRELTYLPETETWKREAATLDELHQKRPEHGSLDALLAREMAGSKTLPDRFEPITEEALTQEQAVIFEESGDEVRGLQCVVRGLSSRFNDLYGMIGSDYPCMVPRGVCSKEVFIDCMHHVLHDAPLQVSKDKVQEASLLADYLQCAKLQKALARPKIEQDPHYRQDPYSKPIQEGEYVLTGITHGEKFSCTLLVKLGGRLIEATIVPSENGGFSLSDNLDIAHLKIEPLVEHLKKRIEASQRVVDHIGFESYCDVGNALRGKPPGTFVLQKFPQGDPLARDIRLHYVTQKGRINTLGIEAMPSGYRVLKLDRAGTRPLGDWHPTLDELLARSFPMQMLPCYGDIKEEPGYHAQIGQDEVQKLFRDTQGPCFLLRMTDRVGVYEVCYRDSTSSEVKRADVTIGENGIRQKKIIYNDNLRLSQSGDVMTVEETPWCRSAQQLVTSLCGEELPPIPKVVTLHHDVDIESIKARLDRVIFINRDEIQLVIREKLTQAMAEELIYAGDVLHVEDLVNLLSDVKGVRLPTKEMIIKEAVRRFPACVVILSDAERNMVGAEGMKQACISYINELTHPDSQIFRTHEELNSGLGIAALLLEFAPNLTKEEKRELGEKLIAAIQERRPPMMLEGNRAFRLDKQFKEIGQKIWDALDLGTFRVAFNAQEQGG